MDEIIQSLSQQFSKMKIMEISEEEKKKAMESIVHKFSVMKNANKYEGETNEVMNKTTDEAMESLSRNFEAMRITNNFKESIARSACSNK